MVRQQTGEGQYIDISLVDAGLAWTVWESGAFFGAGEVPQPTGTRHRRSTPYQAYRTSDGYVTIGAANDRLWKRLVTDGAGAARVARGRPRFAPCPTGWTNIDELEHEIEAITIDPHHRRSGSRSSTRPASPAGQVLTYDETLTDPHVLARDMVVEVEHPIIGPMRTIGPPTKFSDARLRRPRPGAVARASTPPRCCADTGVSDDEIDQLFADGVALRRPPRAAQELTED